MCGRFTLEVQLELLFEHFDVHGGTLELTPRFNIAPTQQIPVVRNDGERNTLTMMRWGLARLTWLTEERTSCKKELPETLVGLDLRLVH